MRWIEEADGAGGGVGKLGHMMKRQATATADVLGLQEGTLLTLHFLSFCLALSQIVHIVGQEHGRYYSNVFTFSKPVDYV
jgi:hypothetical protein